MTRPFARSAALLLPLILLCPMRADAQAERPLLGLAFNTMLSSTESLGFGFRARASFPMNSDLSFAADMGVIGFVLEGQDDAVYVLDPQGSIIVTLPGSREYAPYLLAGVGGIIPVSSKGVGGPTIHFGVGMVRQLSDTVLFYEVDPALVIGPSEVSLALPFRLGVIF